jgi:uncharacterized protein YndB with AHSA1/START domain
MKEVKVEAELKRPVTEVFDYIADAENIPAWMDQFDAVIQTADGQTKKNMTYKYKVRRGPQSHFKWVEFERPHKLGWKGPPIKGAGGSLAPVGNYTFEERDGATHVTARVVPEIQGIMRLAKPLMRRSLRNVFRQDFERLRKILEADPSQKKAAIDPAEVLQQALEPDQS